MGRVTTKADTFEWSLGRWRDESGWSWHVVPKLSIEQERVMSMTALSKSNVWLAVRTTDDKNPKYYGADTLLNWTGSSFEVAHEPPDSVRVLAADREGGYFALSTDGGFYRGAPDGKLTLLGDAGTAGESSYAICTPLIAPVPGAKAWVLDSVCKLSFWNGTKLVSKPTFRSGIHGSGHISFELASTGEDSLWVTDPQQGLIHYDGTSWKQVWHSENVPHGIWAADDDHVWLIDQPYSSGGGVPVVGSAAVMRVWDGKAMQTVGATPHCFFLSGSKDSVWLAGDTSLLRLMRTSDQPE
jgi:hypothetical protein